MIKAHYKTANGRITVEVQGEGVKDVYRDLAQMQEVFDAESQCGCCQSANIRLQYREVDSYKFYELRCRDCGAQFQFGQKKQGGALFPKRRNDEGKPMPNGGWAKWDPNAARDDDHEPAASRPARASQQQTNGGKQTLQVIKFQNWDEAEQAKEWGNPAFILEIADESGRQFHIPKGQRSYAEFKR